MSLSINRYATARQLQDRLDAAGSFTAAETALHNASLGAAADMIDEECGRTFHRETATLVFTPSDVTVLRVPDLVSVTTLKTDEDGDQSYERTWSTGDYLLCPTNAQARERQYPYTEIHVNFATASLKYAFPVGLQNSVQVAGVWGWPSVPDAIQEVCILEAQRLISQSNAPSGVISNDAGAAAVVPAMHPTSRRLLQPYRKTGIGAAHGRR